MTLLDLAVLALVRGIGEVLPIGVSAHLAFIPRLSGPGAAEVGAAADLGVAVAIAVTFWRDMLAMGKGLWKARKGRLDAGGRRFLLVMSAFVPAFVLGWAFTWLGAATAGATATAAALLVFGVFLLVADFLGVRVKRMEHMSLQGAFVIGLLQSAAVIPGVSRVGIAITAQRLMGYERPSAAYFALLLTLPGLVVSGVSGLWRAHQAGMILSGDLALAASIAATSALLAAAGMMAWTRDHTYAPFAAWRIVLGGLLLARILLA